MSIRGLWSSMIRSKSEKLSFVVVDAFSEVRIDHALAVANLDLPRQSLSRGVTRCVKEKLGIEIEPYTDAKPLILIGQDNWCIVTPNESRQLKNGSLAASRSTLGWVLHGYIEAGRDLKLNLSTLASRCELMQPKNIEQRNFEDLDNLVRGYFELENLGVAITGNENGKHERALAILESTKRKRDGYWETGSLWRSGLMPSVDGKKTALKRLYSLERKLDKDLKLAAQYYKEIERWIENGYIVKIMKDVPRPREWYIPHFPVRNSNKPEKVRPVLDAAAKTQGFFFNDFLETGPDFLESLLEVLLRFRQSPIAVIADIKDMYLRVKVIERDRGAQRFFWRGADRVRKPDVWENTGLIFGSKSSPCSAIYVKNNNAETFAKEKPEAARSIVKNSYMDDYLASERLISICMAGHRTALGKRDKANLCDEEERVLGLYWDRNQDTLSFNVGLSKICSNLARGEVAPTKREFFSIAMSVYDPLGVLSPFTLQAKLVMQDIWRSGFRWDQAIRTKEFKVWVIWLKNLLEMKNCKIPRYYLTPGSDNVKTQLHIFCDTSLKAYAAAAYLRPEASDGQIHLSLVMAKSRVAPVKPMTVPRLELQAALLGARMADIVGGELEVPIHERVFWSDSSTVLHWICADPIQKQMFVANRLGEIGELTKVAEWGWIPTSLNPADDATRPSDLPMRSDDRWLIGPKFLLKGRDSWPKEKTMKDSEKRAINELEARKEFIGAAFVRHPEMWMIPIRVRLLGWKRMLRPVMRGRQIFNVWRQYRGPPKERVARSKPSALER
ncbi:uncharacterized protein LOC124305548 [Neodiprion virginianus]|uniref:uncharacterized protein LOC124305548 n=1 Tax=Neodiprion virginianus TaxID=2961670 RepID=UPI001EE71E30|nr:uncharacterized protein LOC124305548 [Neodiprion virginianus]